MKRVLLWICGILALGLLAMAGVLGLASRDDDGPVRSRFRSNVMTSAPDFTHPVLRRNDGGEILVAANPDALWRLVALIAARDMVGIRQLVGAGLLHSVPSDTACEIIVQVPDSPAIKVRVLGGSRDDFVGWVHTNVVYR